jgi:hypothetical protein
MNKNENLIDYILEIYWYWRYRFSAWRKGVIGYHISVYDFGGEPAYKIWKDSHILLNTPKSSFIPWNENQMLADQTEVEQNYIRKYKLTNQEIGELHMSFSPRRVPGNLSFWEVKHAIDKYRYKTSLQSGAKQ